MYRKIHLACLMKRIEDIRDALEHLDDYFYIRRRVIVL